MDWEDKDFQEVLIVHLGDIVSWYKVRMEDIEDGQMVSCGTYSGGDEYKEVLDVQPGDDMIQEVIGVDLEDNDLQENPESYMEDDE